MAILKHIDGIPLYSTIGEALQYAADNGLSGYHTHTYSTTTTGVYGETATTDVIGYMGGSAHTDVVSVKEITGLVINMNALPATETARSFVVTGDEGAVFSLWVVNEDYSYYNFYTKAFIARDSVSSCSNCKVQETINSSGVYKWNITFPAITDDDHYYIFLQADGHYNTKLHDSLGVGLLYVTSKIEQFTDTTITYSLLHSSGTVTEPSNITVEKPKDLVRSSGDAISSDINWEITTSSVFVLLRQPTINDFETTTTKVMTGNDTTGSDTYPVNSFEVADVNNLLVGMEVAGDGISGSPTITQINPPTIEEEQVALLSNTVLDQSATDRKIIVISGSGHDVAKDVTLTFTGYGTSGTEAIYDTSFDIVDSVTGKDDFACALTDITTNVDGATSSSTSVTVDSSAGTKVETTQTVDGLTTSSTSVTLDSVTGLWIGQTLMAVSSGTLDGTPTILTITSSTKTITLSTEQTFADGITLTFANSIVSGIGVDGVPYVDTVSSSTAVVLSSAFSLEDNIKLTITGSGQTATITGTIQVYNVGGTDFTTTLNLDNILLV